MDADRTRTGIGGLDAMLGGGLPRERVVLILGEPGAGKTIMSVQFLVKGALEYDEKGVFVCIEEVRPHLYREMAKFGWDLEQLEKDDRLSFLDATPLRLLPSTIKVGDLSIDRKDFSLSSLTEAIRREADRLKPARIVVDSITSLMIQYQDTVQRRNALMDLIGTLVSTEATCIITSDLRSVGLRRRIEMEEFLTHGVIVLQTIRFGSSMTRALQIEKMRETSHDSQPRPYRITDKGIEVYPGEPVLK